jgi:DNA-binding LacI/PurR family transcriptional regulator
MRSVIRFLSAAVLMAAWHSSITAVNAQNAQQTSPGLSALGSSVPTPVITDQKLDAVAAAFQKVSTLQEKYRHRFATAATPSDQTRITAEANRAVSKAVADQGLSVEEYISIVEVALDDPEICGKILEHMRPQREHQ